MQLAYFTEEPFYAYPEGEAAAEGYEAHALTFPNRYFDAAEAARLYAERIEELKYAETVGFDGVMFNEHHNTPYTMHPRINISATVAAAVTERLKIILLGNPLPVFGNPLQCAEELAMIDLISKGRLVSGFVRGGGIEQLAHTSNPAFNRELFEEAHDLIVKAWTEPGPFRWEGDMYHYRVVNPWTLPLQKPHPRIYIPGAGSRDTVTFAARRRYPYVALATNKDKTATVWNVYDEVAREVGYEMGPPERGYLVKCHVAETEEKALQQAHEYAFMNRSHGGYSSDWLSPPGYDAPETRRTRLVGSPYGHLLAPIEEQLENGTLICGTPPVVIEKLRALMERLRMGTMVFWANDGRMDHEDSMTCIRLLGEEVLPRCRDFARELDLKDPFEANTPVSVAHMRELAIV